MFSSILQRKSCDKNKIDDQKVEKKEIDKPEKSSNDENRKQVKNDEVNHAKWLDDFNVLKIAREINDSVENEDKQKNVGSKTEKTTKNQQKSVRFNDQKLSSKDLINKRMKMATEKNLHLNKVIDKKGRKIPRILRNRLKTFSNNESRPINIDEEDSEETVSDVETTYDNQKIVSAVDILLDMELAAKRKQKEKERKKRQQMVKSLKKGVIKKKTEETKKRKREEEKDNKKEQSKEKQNKKLKNEKKLKEEKSKAKKKKPKKTKEDSRKRKEKSVSKIAAKLYSIRTRSSPKKMYECVVSLTDKQKNIIKEIGFGKLLKMVVNGIPAKLGYYVVDNFNPKSMEIKVGKLTIKVDEEAIEKLRGLPKGVDLECENNKREEIGPDGKSFQERYGVQMISCKRILQKINFSDDKEGHLFKYDFIVLFINTMVECHLNGLCKLGIVDKIGCITDFTKINWCKYIVSVMRRAKDGWVPRDISSYFRGALTILTLLYVDSITCKGINENRDCHPLYYWTMDKLQLREDLELENGGFGKGD